MQRRSQLSCRGAGDARVEHVHRPLSDLFIVYNEQRQTELDITAGRGLIVKYTRMLSF